MVGLDGAGKTTIIYKMNLQDMIPALPLGSGFETVEFQKVKLTAWDLQSDEP
jgi:GTPase SAR1 family protein